MIFHAVNVRQLESGKVRKNHTGNRGRHVMEKMCINCKYLWKNEYEEPCKECRETLEKKKEAHTKWEEEENADDLLQ